MEGYQTTRLTCAARNMCFILGALLLQIVSHLLFCLNLLCESRQFRQPSIETRIKKTLHSGVPSTDMAAEAAPTKKAEPSHSTDTSQICVYVRVCLCMLRAAQQDVQLNTLMAALFRMQSEPIFVVLCCGVASLNPVSPLPTVNLVVHPPSFRFLLGAC